MRGERLRQKREERGLTQKDLADRVKVSDQQIYRYEVGKSDPTGDVLMRMARELDVSTDYLLGLVDKPGEHLTIQELTGPERRWLEALRHGRVEDALDALKEAIANADSD